MTQEAEELDPQEEESKLKSYWLYLLGRRDYSASELLRKAGEKGYRSELAEEMLLVFQERDWQSEERFIEAFSSRKRSQGYSRYSISYHLKQKHGIDSSKVQACWERTDFPDDEEILEEFLSTSDRGGQLKRKGFQKALAYLSRRGYSYELAKRWLVKLGIEASF